MLSMLKAWYAAVSASEADRPAKGPGRDSATRGSSERNRARRAKATPIGTSRMEMIRDKWMWKMIAIDFKSEKLKTLINAIIHRIRYKFKQ